jgi:hypothetical protein
MVLAITIVFVVATILALLELGVEGIGSLALLQRQGEYASSEYHGGTLVVACMT